MRRLILIAAGAAVGYVLGARAGRPAYDRIVASWNRVATRTGLTQTAETMSSAAENLRDAGLDRAADGLGTVGDRAGGALDDAADKLRHNGVDVSDDAVRTKASAVEE